MIEVISALAVGMVTGLVFSFFKLPLPAPPVLSGIIGIFGVYLGSICFNYLSKFY